MKKTLSAILAILMLITCFVSVVIPASAATTCDISDPKTLSTAISSKTGEVVWNITKDFALIKKTSVTFTDSCDLVIEGNGHTLTCSSEIEKVIDSMFGLATKISEDKHVTVTINNLNLVSNEKVKHVIISNIGTTSSHGITMILNNVTIDHTNSAEGGGNCAIINNSGDLTLSGSIVISTGINSYSAIDNDNARGQASLTIASGANLTINDNRIFTERMRNPVIQSDMGGTDVNMRFVNYSSAKLVPVQRTANAGYEFGETFDTNNTKELDMNYNVDVRDASWTDVTKVKLTWVIEEINAAYTSRKVWNPDKLSWDEVREDASAPTANAAFTIVNFSSKEIIASAAFAVVEDEDVKATFSSAYYTNNGKKIGTVVNKDYTIDDEKKANVPANTIGAAIEFHEDKFTALDATTEAAKYGTFTITIAEVSPCEACKVVDDNTAKLFETFGITTYVGLLSKTAEISALLQTFSESTEYAQLKSLKLSGKIAQGGVRFLKADGSFSSTLEVGNVYVMGYEYYCVDHPETRTFVPFTY